MTFLDKEVYTYNEEHCDFCYQWQSSICRCWWLEGETHADRILAYLINYFIRRKDAISHIID